MFDNWNKKLTDRKGIEEFIIERGERICDKLKDVFKDIEKSNVKVLLNNSFSLDKGYFSLFDIKNVIKKNIDYTLDKSMYIKNIDKYIMDGKILTLNNQGLALYFLLRVFEFHFYNYQHL